MRCYAQEELFPSPFQAHVCMLLSTRFSRKPEKQYKLVGLPQSNASRLPLLPPTPFVVVRRHQGIIGRERQIWTPQQLRDAPDAFLSEIKTSLQLRPSVTTTYLFLTPTESRRTVGGPIMSMQRSYSIHYRNSTKAKTSLTNQPFKSLYGGVFLSGAEAKHYGDIFRAQGLSFTVEGVAGAKEYLAENVERAREVGDTLDVHTALLPLALLSGVSEDDGETSAGRAVVDVSRVTKSAAARHRSLRNLCDYIQVIMGSLAEWTQASRPILHQSEDAGLVHDDPGTNENESGWNPKTRCRSSRDLVQTWTRTAHLLFWGWRCDVLRYLDEDRHSDVVVVKDRVRRWIEEISSTSRMGLRLPMLRWHDHGRTIADGKGAFFDAVALVRRRLSSLSAWLHCLDLSLAWDAAKVCDRVHAQHLEKQSRSGAIPHGGWNLLNFQLGVSGTGAQARESTASLPTAAGLLQLQRGWLDDIVADAHVRDMKAAKENDNKRTSRRRRKSSAASTAAAVEAAMANGVRYVPAPAAPDSNKVAKGVDVRQAVVATLREDVVPEALAHELTLMKYAAENRLDKSLHDSLSDLLTSVLTPNPFPVLTDALAVSSTSTVLRRTVDSDGGRSPPAAALKPVGRGGGEEGKKVFVARGAQKDEKVYGSKPALTDVDVQAALSIFGVLPPVAGWALDALGDDCEDVQVGIFGCARRHGSLVHHAVPSDLTVMLACACDFDLDSGATPVEHFARCAVHCATAAHDKSALLVIGLAARTGFEDEPGSPGVGTPGGDRFPLTQVLHEPEEVEDELALLGPEEIVIEALVPYPTPGGGEALVPISIRLLLVTESSSPVSAPGDSGGLSEASAASMFYDCVFSTATAAESVAARFTALAEESDLPQGHVKRTRRRVSESVDKGDYLEVYQLVHCLRSLRSAVPVDDVKSAPKTPESEEVDSSKGTHEAVSHTSRLPALGADGDAGVTVALKRMAKGPAGRLYHARRLLGVLHKVVLKESLPPEMLALLDGTTIRQHAEYCITYLLDTLAEQPIVRFEGAVHSIKLRARLLLDRVMKMTEVEELSESAATQAVGMNATQESACDLAGATTSMLEIVQLAAESDTHRCCCPEMDSMLEQLRGVERTRQKPRRVVGRGGRRIDEAARSGATVAR